MDSGLDGLIDLLPNATEEQPVVQETVIDESEEGDEDSQKNKKKMPRTSMTMRKKPTKKIETKSIKKKKMDKKQEEEEEKNEEKTDDLEDDYVAPGWDHEETTTHKKRESRLTQTEEIDALKVRVTTLENNITQIMTVLLENNPNLAPLLVESKLRIGGENFPQTARTNTTISTTSAGYISQYEPCNFNDAGF